MRTAVLMFAFTSSAGCAGLPRVPVAVGPEPGFEPVIESRPQARRFTLDLARPAHVAALQIAIPAAASQLPVTISVGYPVYPTDQKFFEAGRHLIRPRPRKYRATTNALPLECQSNEQPRLDGCRRSPELMPGLSQWIGSNERYGRRAVLVIVSQQFIDPFMLADFLYWNAFTDWQMTARLRDGGDEQLAIELDRVLTERLGESGWSAVVEVTWGAAPAKPDAERPAGANPRQ